MKKHINKMIIIYLVLSGLAGAIVGCTGNVSGNAGKLPEISDSVASTIGNGDLPQVGNVIEGFIVTGVYDFPQRSGTIFTLRHESVGTEIIYVANSDEDVAFDIFFRTRINNDTGIPHIFEHVTLSGSGKYSNSNLWDQIAMQSYVTDVNACTFAEATSYHASSLSDEQLLAVFDYYMDGLTDPLALRDSNPLSREAYRFQLYEPEDELFVTGAVFNEMEAANSSIENQAETSIKKHLYPGSVMGANAGGEREAIITVDVPQLQEFYEKYYHPSNMMVALYGNMDYAKYLHLLDTEYLSGIEKQEIDLSDNGYEPFIGCRECIEYFAAENGSSIENAGILIYGITLDNISAYDCELLNSVLSVISDTSSNLSKRIQSEYPGSELKCFVDMTCTIPLAEFVLKNTNEGDEQNFRNIIQEELANLLETGLDRFLLEGTANRLKADNLINVDMHGGISLLDNLGMAWAVSDGVESYMDMIRADEGLMYEADKGKLEDLIREYLIEPRQSAMVNVIPKPGLYEEQWNHFEQILKEKKSAMSKESIERIIADTIEFDEWSEAQSRENLLPSVNVTDIDDLDVHLDEVQVEEIHEDGITEYISEIDSAGYIKTSLIFNGNKIPTNRLHDFRFLSALLGKVDTDNYTWDELVRYMEKDLYSSNIGISLQKDYETQEARISLVMEYTAIDDNAGKGWDYLAEILNTSDFSDKDRLRTIISNEYNLVKNDIDGNPASYSRKIARAMQDDSYKLGCYISGLEYYNYLQQLTTLNDSELAEKVMDWQAVLDIIKNKDELIYTAIGDREAMNVCYRNAKMLIDRLDDSTPKYYNYAEELSDRELHSVAIISADASNYNGIVASNKVLGRHKSGKTIVMDDYVMSKVLYPEFRYNIGAYGATVEGTENYLSISSYRDPYVRESVECLESIPEIIECMEINQEDVDEIILKSYSDYAYPESRQNLIENTMKYMILNKKESYTSEINRLLDELKNVTTEDIYAGVEDYRELIDNGIKYGAGNGSKIKKSGVYEDIINVFER